jgi:hypothetical protein
LIVKYIFKVQIFLKLRDYSNSWIKNGKNYKTNIILSLKSFCVILKKNFLLKQQALLKPWVNELMCNAKYKNKFENTSLKNNIKQENTFKKFKFQPIIPKKT